MYQSKFILGLILAGGAFTCSADTVFLTDGSEVNGTIVQNDGQTVVVKLANGSTRSIRRANIDTIIKEAPKVAKPEAPKIPPIAVTPVAPPIVAGPTGVPGKTPIAASGQAAPPPGQLSAPKGMEQPNKNGGSLAPRAASEIANGAAPEAGKLPAEPVVKVITPTPETPSNIVVSDDAGAKTTAPKADALGAVPIENFPDNSKRMSKRKESLLKDALEAIKGNDEALREAAVADMQGLGAEVIPYAWAGVQNENASVRVASMKVLGNLSARNCTKRVIETLYMTMPPTSQAATWNVPFVRVMKATLATLTGQSFISVEPKSVGVQDGLKKYIEWYNANYERLPRQVGEPEVDPADPEFSKKLAELRKLKLMKREWSRPGGMPVDVISGPNTQGPGREEQMLKDSAEREVDKKYGESIPKVGRDEANKLGAKPVYDKSDAFVREQDKTNDSRIKNTVTDRDPPVLGAGAKNDPAKSGVPKAADALKRPQDLQREQEGRKY